MKGPRAQSARVGNDGISESSLLNVGMIGGDGTGGTYLSLAACEVGRSKAVSYCKANVLYCLCAGKKTRRSDAVVASQGKLG